MVLVAGVFTSTDPYGASDFTVCRLSHCTSLFKEVIMPRKKKLTKKLKQLVCDELASGITITEICDRGPHKDVLPHSKNVYKEQQKDDEFYRNITKSYELFFQVLGDELEYVSKTSTIVLYPDTEDFRERAQAQRIRVDTLKFQLGKMAPILTKRYSVVSKLEHSGDLAGPQIIVQNFGVKDESELN